MKILIVGGAGFIGSHTAERLIKKGHGIYIIDNYSTGNRDNIKDFIDYDNVLCAQIPPVFEKDTAIDNLFKKEKFDAVIHLAAQANVRRSIENPISDAMTNVVGSIFIFELCRKYGIKKIVFSSSGGTVYGESDLIPTPEWHTEAIPSSPYGVAKLSIEHYLDYYQKNNILEPIILRYGNVYGPRQSEKSEAGVISIFIRQMLNNENPTIFGDGNKTRDYVYVDDVVDANELALTCCGKPYDIFNIGTGKETSVNDLFNELNKRFDNKIVAKFLPDKVGEINRSCLDIEASENYLKWKPKTTLYEGIDRTFEWVRKELGK
jgi:UDP-glucose 4-epimerase